MIWDNKTAYFQAQLPVAPGITTTTDFSSLINPKDVVSLSIVEKFGQITTGNLELRDPKNIYSRIIPRGAYINIAWGYKRSDQNLAFLDPGLDVAQKGLTRRGFIGFIQGPKGGGSSGGETTYNAQFSMFQARGAPRKLTFDGGRKDQAVLQILSNMGIDTTEINFDRGKDSFSTGYEMQWETDFKTLARWAGEWQALFRIGHLVDGTIAAVFIDPYRVGNSPLINKMSQAGLDSTTLVYRSSKAFDIQPNVQSYSWEHQDGLNGAGDGQILYLQNGVGKFQSYHVADETVTAWKLNESKVSAYINGTKEHPVSLEEAGIRSQRIIQAQSFNEDEVKRLFDPVDLKTAPNGIGYSMRAKLLGTPYLTPGMTASFAGDGFPDFFTPPKSTNAIRFYFDMVTHTLSAAGYFTDVEIVDVYSQSPTGASLVAAGG